MRKALIVGIDYYDNGNSLSGCVNDARSVTKALERHANGTLNFQNPRVMTATCSDDRVKRAVLKDAIRELFADDSEIALFYFAGHGFIEETGGYLCGSDSETGDDGVPLAEIMMLANQSPAKNTVMLLDSCHSGIAGNHPGMAATAEIREGMTVLTASTAQQYAMEVNGGGAGVFTNLLVDALNGAAANLVGDITPGSVYAHIDQSLGPWAQRPMFKTNVKTFVSLRNVTPPVPLEELQALVSHFPGPEDEFELDPSFEPERSPEQKADPSIPPPDPGKTAIFAVLQNYARVNLVRPVDAPHMWHAAWYSKSCKLTDLGRHYWSLVDRGLI